MVEVLKNNNFIKAISNLYLILFCILKILALTNDFVELPINIAMFALGCIIMLMMFIKNSRVSYYPSMLMLFIVAIIFNIVFNFDIATIKNRLFEIFYIFIIYNISKEYLENSQYIKLIKLVLIISFTIVFIFFIKYIYTLMTFGNITKNMIVNIVFTNINGGAILALVNIIMTGYMCKIKKINSKMAFFLIVYYTVFIIISKSRTALLTLCVLVCYLAYDYFFKNNRYIQLKKILRIILIYGSISIIIITSFLLLKRNYDFNNKIDNLIYSTEKKLAKDTSLRYWLWKYSIKELNTTNPLFGLKANFGRESFQNIDDFELLNTISQSQKNILSRNNLHNGYIQILVENGIFGFAIIMMFFIMFILEIFRIDSNNPYNKYIKCLYISYIVINLFENNIVLSNTFFVLFLWIHLGMDSNTIKSNKIMKRRNGEEMNTILYITYTDMKETDSGSKVRPQKIYKAFLDMGYNVKLLKGIASKKNKKERVSNIKEIEQWLKNNKPQYCYIESPSDPIIFRKDRNLIKMIHKKGIKIGYFYRDAYYKLGKEYIFNNEKVNFISKKYLKYIFYRFLFWRDEQLIKRYVDIVYFPSKSMASFFKFKDMMTLPPAGELIDFNRNSDAESVIYVGGITEEYGIKYLLEAMDKINKEQYIKLLLICRENEKKYIEKKYIDKKWLEIYHISGTEKLKPLYEQSKIALLPKKPSLYNNFAISVKIFEYMSYGLPIVAMNTTETTNWIQKYNIGVISNDNAEEFANMILKVYNNKELYDNLVNNVKKALISENLWSNRIKQITNDLMNL